MYVNVMVVVVATRWFLSTHWHRYCTRATCSVVVFFGGGGRCTYAIVTVMVVGLFHPLQHMLVAFFSSLTGAEAVLALEQIALFGDGSGCSYGDMIATCTAGWHPDLCTLCLPWLSLAAIYGGGASPSAIGTDSPCTRGGFTHSNLHWWCFSFHPLAQIPDLHSGNLHCVVTIIIILYYTSAILHANVYI